MPCPDFPPPKTLKECLQLLASLSSQNPHNTTVKNNVIKKLKNDLKEYCDDSYLSKFANGSTGYLDNVFVYSHPFLSMLLSTTQHMYYASLTEHSSGDDIVRALAECLPKAFSALYFLYFNTCSTLESVMGGGWKDEYLRGSGPNNDLYNWLRDETSDTGHFMRRGFNDVVFKDNQRGSSLNIFLKQLVSHDDISSTNGVLPSALLPMLFICPWFDALTGHALCFLYYFCDKVTQQEYALKSGFNVVSWHALQHACRNLGPCLEFFIGQTAILSAVCCNNTNLYSSVWDVSKFPQYLTWLWDHLKSIIVALSSMLTDSTKWRQSNLKAASTAGPFKYGFVFSTSWSGTFPQSQLEGPVTKLIYALLRLLEPHTLKTSLRLLGQLHYQPTLKSEVISRLRTLVQPYCAEEYLGEFAQKSNQGHLARSFALSDLLLRLVLPKNPYGPYSGLDHCDPDDIVRALVECMPRAFSALYFLYFNTCNPSSLNGSGQWKQYKVNSGTKLGKWLRDRTGRASCLMPRGFQPVELHTSTARGSDLAKHAKNLVCHSTAGPFQKVLTGMFFMCPWHHYKLGHALCFLDQFCSQVTPTEALRSRFQTQIHGLNWPKFQSVCKSLKSSLGPFIGPNAILSAVCWNNASLYSRAWHNDKLDSYILWLRLNIYDLIASLESMLKDSSDWTILYLQSAISAGPFRFGIVFSRSWSGTSPESQLKGPVTELILSLQALSNWLDPLYNTLYNATQVGLYSAEMGLGLYGTSLGLSAGKLGLEFLDNVFQAKTKEEDEEEEEQAETGDQNGTDENAGQTGESSEENEKIADQNGSGGDSGSSEGTGQDGSQNGENSQKGDSGSKTPSSPTEPSAPESPPKSPKKPCEPPGIPCRILRKSLAPRLISAQALWPGVSWPAWASLHWAPWAGAP